MESFINVFHNNTLWIAVMAWFIAQLIKFFTELVRNKRVRFVLFFSSGGMPSSHTAFVTAMAAGIGLTEGFDTPIFALAAVISIVIMYDAAGVRRAAGKHAAAINTIFDAIDSEDKIDEKLKELLGHSPLEVLAGAALGIGVGYLITRSLRYLM